MPRGGARPNTGGSHGGGRPKELEKPVRFYVTLEQVDRAALEAYCTLEKCSLSEAVRRAVRALGEGEENKTNA